MITRVTVLLLLVFSLPAHADETHVGRLDETDPTLERGEYFDQYEFVTEPGDRLVVDLYSRDFDTYLALVSPTNVLYRNASYRGRAGHCRFEMLDLEGGAWAIVATSENIVTGAYRLEIRAEDGQAGTVVRHEIGELTRGDRIVDSKFYEDVYTIDLSAGQTLLADLTARRFDTFLTVEMPDGRELTSDDFMDAINHSRVEAIANPGGEATVRVRSYDPEGEGRYSLRLVVR